MINTFKKRLFTTGSDLIYKKLKENNVKDVFLYSGGSIMHLIDKFYNGDISYYINTHEQSTGHSATGYAKSSNKCGVAIVTSGPGVTNMVTPLLDAQNDSTPFVLLSGQVALDNMRTRAFQECDATNITKTVTKWNYCVKDVNELDSVIDCAFGFATSGKPGSVHIDLPKDILIDKVTDIKNYPKNYYCDEINIKPDMNVFEKIINKINNSKKPVLYIGKGANMCSNELKKLVDKFQIPITNTLHAQGVYDTTKNLSLNFLGMHGNAAANMTIQNSDCIIAIGSRFDDRTTGNVDYYAPYAHKNKAIIHCNIDTKEYNLSVNTYLNINMDSKDFIEALYDNLKYVNRNNWLEQVNKLKNKYPFIYTPTKELKTQEVICEINRQLVDLKLDNKTIITTGVGNHQMMASQFIDWKYPKRFITSGSLGVMGAGLPYAIGCQIANPESIVIDIDGDGSFNHTLSELKTLVEYNLPIKIAIMNDFHHSMVKVWEELFFKSRFTATSTPKNPEYSELAKSFGIKGIKCSNKYELTNCVKEFLEYQGPIVADFRVVTDKCYPLVAPGKALDDIILPYEQRNKNYEFSLNNIPPS